MQNKILKILIQIIGSCSDKSRIRLLILFFLTILASFFEACSLASLLPFLNTLTGNSNQFNEISIVGVSLLKIFGFNVENILLTSTLIFSAAILIAASLRILTLWLQVYTGAQIGEEISGKVYLRILHQSYQDHIERHSSDVISIIVMKINVLVGSILIPSLAIASSVSMVIAIMATLIYIDPAVAICAFIILSIIYVCIFAAYKKSISDDSRLVNVLQGNLIKLLQEGLGGIRDVILNSAHNYYYLAFKNIDMQLRMANARVQFLSGSPRFIIECFGTILIITLTYYLAKKNTEFSSAIPVIGALALGLQRLLPLLQTIYANFMAIRGNLDSALSVMNILNQSVGLTDNPNGEVGIEFNESILLKNVSYRYIGSESLVLNDLNLKINKNTSLGIVGETGSGKSTLIDLIMGLLEPSKGSLFIDNIQVVGHNIGAWRKNISHVPQAIFLADTTIAENIALTSTIDIKRVIEVCEIAQIAEFISTLPRGYYTKVGESGFKLSGGQRQRIGIARALYKNSKLLILDEATSALDANTEKLVMDGISSFKNDLTLIIVSHRLTTLDHCNEIISLSNGQVISGEPYNNLN